MGTQNLDSTLTPKVDIIIVGAGLSGLTSAVNLLQKEKSLQLKILEASNFIGGQIGVTNIGEIGGKWVTKDQYHIMYLLDLLKLPTHRRTVLSPDLKRCWDIDDGIFSSFAKYELSRYIHELELRVEFFKSGKYDDILQKQSRSMERHIKNRLFFRKSRNFMLNLVILTTGMDPSEVSFEQFMNLCYSHGGLQSVIDMHINYSSNLLEISSNDLLQSLIDKLQFIEILCWRKVHKIRQFKDFVEVFDSELEVHTADAIILAIPWNSIVNISFSPPIPSAYQCSKYPKNKNKFLTSFLIKYTDGYWRTNGYSGNYFLGNPLIVGYEYRPTVFSGVTLHDEGSESTVKNLVLTNLSKQFGEKMLLPIEYYQRTFEMSKLWNSPHTTPWKRIIWSSSTSAATCYRGTLNGAVQSGLCASMNALFLVRPQTVSWRDLAEGQCPNNVQKSCSWIPLVFSTWNLYNVTYYSLFVCGVVCFLRHFYVKQQ